MKKIVSILLLIGTLTSQAGWLSSWFTPKQESSWLNWKTFGIGGFTLGSCFGLALLKKKIETASQLTKLQDEIKKTNQRNTVIDQRVNAHIKELQKNSGFIYEGMDPITITDNSGNEVATINLSTSVYPQNVKTKLYRNQHVFNFSVTYKNSQRIPSMFTIDPLKP